MTFQHRELAAGRWKELSFLEQMANVGGEIERTLNWKRKGNRDYSNRAFERALELLDLTIDDDKNRSKLKEIVRVREALADHFAFDNIYRSSDSSWQKYFYSFAFAAQNNRQHGGNPFRLRTRANRRKPENYRTGKATRKPTSLLRKNGRLR